MIKKAREHRQQELLELLHTGDGCEEIIGIWHRKVVGYGREAPAGVLVSQMIEQILDREFSSECN